jgi:hypothetical protein
VQHLPPGFRLGLFRVKIIGFRACIYLPCTIFHLVGYGFTTRGLRCMWLPFKYDSSFSALTASVQGVLYPIQDINVLLTVFISAKRIDTGVFSWFCQFSVR